MTRSFLRILFLIVFTLLSSGVVTTLHICKDQVMGLEWFSGESKKCPCSKKEMDKGCCDTLVIHFDHEDATPTSQPAVPVDSVIAEVEIPDIRYQIESDDFNTSSLGMQASNPVPIIPIWLINQSIRIPDAC